MIRHRPDGTGFRLFPQYAEGYAEPELVLVSRRAGTIGPGPSDATMYVANAVDKESQYDPPAYMPPYRGTMFAPALPDRCGNFDYIPVDTEQFLAAHLYGTMRHTLDVWELYLRRQVVWWHASFLPQLELIPVVRWRNAHCGPGFLEAGIIANRYGRGQLFCLNFDVIAHETGHAILFSQVGAPPADRIHGPYLAFHESFADLVSLIAALHFPSVVQRLLQQTDGNLYVLNLVNRLGEYSDKEQVRLASNTVTMADVGGLRLGPDGDWIDPLGLDRNAHALAEPLTGAIFDIFVEIYQDGLVARGLIPPDADARGWTREEVAASLRMVRHEFGTLIRPVHAGLPCLARSRARPRGAVHGACDADDSAGELELRRGRGEVPGGRRPAWPRPEPAGAARPFPVARDRPAAVADRRGPGTRTAAVRQAPDSAALSRAARRQAGQRLFVFATRIPNRAPVDAARSSVHARDRARWMIVA